MKWQSSARCQRTLVTIPRRVADRFTAEIRANPKVEVGGKYLGHIRGEGRCETLAERYEALDTSLVFEVTDYLDDGPQAERTGGFHRGDVGWQTQEFRRLEQLDPELEQLGSWHSHHPNGLGTLSSGDIDGYMATVNDRGHNHDFFFVSLGVDKGGFATARHYLFIREDNVFYELAIDNIAIVKDEPVRQDGPASQQGSMGSQSPNPAPAHEEPQDNVIAQQGAMQSPDNRRNETPGQMQSSAAESNNEIGPQLRLPEWSDTPRGRKMLAREQERLRDRAFAGIRFSVMRDRLMAKGPIKTDKGSATISLLYPSAPDRHDGLLKITTIAPPQIQATVPGELSAGLEQAAAVVDEFLQFARGIHRTESLSDRFMKRFRGQQ